MDGFVHQVLQQLLCLPGIVSVESKEVQTASTFEGTPNSCMLLVPLRTLSVCPSVVGIQHQGAGRQKQTLVLTRRSTREHALGVHWLDIYLPLSSRSEFVCMT
jgi:hypothetical protein